MSLDIYIYIYIFFFLSLERGLEGNIQSGLIIIVGSLFGAQTQYDWDTSPMSQIQ